MNIVFIAGILVVLAFAAESRVSAKRVEKHDRVLFRFCQIRRDLMAELRARYDSISPQEFHAAEFLLESLDGVIRHYHRHKTTTFNLRKMRRMIEEDLSQYRAAMRAAEEHLSAAPPGKIAELYADFARAGAEAFIAYTPFIRTEFILRLLWADLADQIAQIRRAATAGLPKKSAA